MLGHSSLDLNRVGVLCRALGWDGKGDRVQSRLTGFGEKALQHPGDVGDGGWRESQFSEIGEKTRSRFCVG